jgi:hypothetical protein
MDAPKRRCGRPAMFPEGGRQVIVYLPVGVYGAIVESMEREGTGGLVGPYVRALLCDALKVKGIL